MSSTGRAPVRHRAPGLPEDTIRSVADLEGTLRGGEHTVAYMRLLWEHRRLLARVALYGFLSSALLAFLLPNRYQSTARLMPPDSNQSGGLAMAAAALSNGAGGLGNMASEMLSLKSNSDIFVGILASRTVQDKLIQEFDLKKLYGARRMEDARIQLAEHSGFSIDRKSQIITISVTDHDPKRAAAMGEAYVAELNRLVTELSTSSARRERVFLEERLKSVSQDLESAEKDLSQFSSKNAAIDIKEQGKAMVEAAALLQGQYIAAQSELEGLKQIYSDNNVRVRAVQARIDELKHQLEKMGGKGESATEVSGQPSDSLYPSIRKLPLLGVTYADLYRRAKIQEVVLETLTKEYEMAKVQEAKEIPTVKVLDAANTPDKKSFPPRLLIIFICTTCVFVAAACWIFAKTAWNDTNPNDARKVFAQEVYTTMLARLPQFERNGSENDTGRRSFLGFRGRGSKHDESPK
jgi:capsule polysaccharide export protein KpsE/RkpR